MNLPTTQIALDTQFYENLFERNREAVRLQEEERIEEDIRRSEIYRNSLVATQHPNRRTFSLSDEQDDDEEHEKWLKETEQYENLSWKEYEIFQNNMEWLYKENNREFHNIFYNTREGCICEQICCAIANKHALDE